MHRKDRWETQLFPSSVGPACGSKTFSKVRNDLLHRSCLAAVTILYRGWSLRPWTAASSTSQPEEELMMGRKTCDDIVYKAVTLKQSVGSAPMSIIFLAPSHTVAKHFGNNITAQVMTVLMRNASPSRAKGHCWLIRLRSTENVVPETVEGCLKSVNSSVCLWERERSVKAAIYCKK